MNLPEGTHGAFTGQPTAAPWSIPTDDLIVKRKEWERLRERYSVAVEVGGELLYDAPFPNGAEAADAMAAFERLVDAALLKRETEAE